MKTILIVGGRLQGIEIAYLARKAGYYTLLLDKDKQAPAQHLVDQYVTGDALDDNLLRNLFARADVVIPALENMAVLKRLVYLSQVMNKRLLFDEAAYNISSSKEKSNALFSRLSLPIPQKYPDCPFPVIVKPDDLSGSAGVLKFDSREQIDHYLANQKKDLVVQEFIEGPSYSLEVVGNGQSYICPQITQIIVDNDYDCKRVVAPAQVSQDIINQFEEISNQLFNELKIKGIFDIEVILHHGLLKILEIDARFPSQTPIAIYHATGINMVKVMVEEDYSCREFPKGSHVCLYQQIQVDRQGIAVLGEHIMSDCRDLKVMEGFFGADVAITNYLPGCEKFNSIIIITAESYKSAYQKFEEVQQEILKSLPLSAVAI
ncbi:3-methylornithine--L-lysine ligase PylC [Eubacteriaceae bacterium ES2]|nr:3-methylornithine--L-lysine ligase PylC [Eubacteriaceae bacterium ES2]